MGQFIFHCGFLDDDMPKEGRSSRGWTRSRYGGLVVGHGNKATRDVENRVEDLCTEDMGWKSLLEEDPNWRYREKTLTMVVKLSLIKMDLPLFKRNEEKEFPMQSRRVTNLENRSQKCEEEIDGHIYALELLLGMEEFLKYAGTFDEVFKEDNKGVLNLDKMVVLFINCINNYLQQSKGEGNNLVKNHMYFHLSQYMRLFGPPTGWDSAASESNHKTEMKAPVKRTQQIKSTLIKQTCKQVMEYRTIDRLDCEFDLFHHKSFTGVSHPTEGGRSAGSKFLISVRDGLSYMKWGKKKTQVCHVVFCAHPSFKSDSGQLFNVWYNWENFQLDLLDGRGLQVYPCQILSVSGFELVHDGYYAIARCFLSVDPIWSKRAQGRRDRHALVKQGVLRNKLYLFECNAIKSEVAVV
eukprot:jgi/Psemu1/20716/gm1.20716_g